MIELEVKVKKVGSSYGFLVPKALVDCKVLPLGEKVMIKITTPEELKSLSSKKPLDNSPEVEWSEVFRSFPENSPVCYDKVNKGFEISMVLGEVQMHRLTRWLRETKQDMSST